MCYYGYLSLEIRVKAKVTISETGGSGGGGGELVIGVSNGKCSLQSK